MGWVSPDLMGIGRIIWRACLMLHKYMCVCRWTCSFCMGGVGVSALLHTLLNSSVVMSQYSQACGLLTPLCPFLSAILMQMAAIAIRDECVHTVNASPVSLSSLTPVEWSLGGS
jgi:hypothetical protein